MPDNKNKKDGRDRGKVASNEDYELAHMAEKLGTNREKIKAAIKAVGNDRKKVEAYLKKMK